MSATKVEVGTPSLSLSGWTATEVAFHGFANLTTTRGEDVESPEFSCFGHQWTLKLFPGGRANSEEGVRDTRDAKGEVVHHQSSEPKEFGVYCLSSTPGNGRCTPDFAERSTIMNSLVNRSLVIEVRMKHTSTDKSINQFIPTNPINKNVLQKFMDEETADVVFEVDNGSCQNEEHTIKKSKTTTTLYAHRFILQDISTMLSELCKSDEGGGDITTVSITDVKPEIFKHMLYNAYGGKLSDDDLTNNAKDIIDACDKYGVVHLKLEAEACYVDSTTFSMDNIMNNLLYADSKNLALLKEAVMDYIVANKHGIMDKVSFDDLPGSLMKDLLAAVARGEADDDGEEDESIKYNRMRVGTLRKMLDQKGLDVDGSREAMIALLKENNDSDDSDSNDDDNGEDKNDVEPVDA